MKRFVKSIVLILVLLVLVIGGLYVYRIYQNLKANPGSAETGNNQTITAPNGETSTDVKYYGHDGRNAFELLKAITAVEYQQFSFGVMVNSINGVKPDSQHFWKLYVNGQASSVGADQVQTHDGDVIEWKIDFINGE